MAVFFIFFNDVFYPTKTYKILKIS